MTDDAAGVELDLAIVGLACRFPGARTPDEFWENLAAGRESIVALSDDELRAAGVADAAIDGPEYVKVHAPIPDLKAFDAGFFGFSPREAAILDPQHRHFLEVAWEAFENAGHRPRGFPGAIGVFAGAGHHHYFSGHLLTRPELLREVGFFLLRHTGNDKDFLATRLSYLLDLRGPSIGVQTACSTSLVAVHLAAQSLLNGECDMALAGGVTIELPEGRGYEYAEGEILSPDGHCRPFDAQSRGTVFGSGCGVVLLRRLADAVADGDTIHAVVKSTAINNDGAQKVGYLAPSVEGQTQVTVEALALAGIEPDSVSYIETHGTGTPVGDPIEIAALAQAYGDGARIAIGSVKSNIGHLDTAAGVASLIKVIQSLKHAELAPTLHFTEDNPACDFPSTPFRVQAERAPWVSSGPRRAGIGSLGVGGTNAHVILEEAPRPAAPEPGVAPHLLTLSAKTPAALERVAERMAAHLERAADSAPLSESAMADTAWTLQVGREEMKHRFALAAVDAADAAARLRDTSTSRLGFRQAAASPPPVTFLFAGGGAQFPGMGRDLYESEPVFREVVDRGLDLLRRRHEVELQALLFPPAGTEAAAAMELERPSRSLPALFILQSASAALWRSWGITPSTLLGHSMGEYTAACEAGVLTFDDALALVHKRAELFERVPEGGMLSVARSAAEVRALLGDDLDIAAENAPDLCVVSGPVDALERFEHDLGERAIECARIRINIAAHSRMLDPILDEWRAFLRTIAFAKPAIPLVSNVTGAPLTDDEAMDPEYWVRQLRETVRFTDAVGAVLGKDPAVLLECGPGRILTTLARRHPARDSKHEFVASLRRPDETGSDRTVTFRSLGRLWSVGLAPDWGAVHQGARRRRIPLPTYPFERHEHWIERVEGTVGESSGGPLKKLPEIERWGFEQAWQRVPGAAPQPVPPQVLVLGGDADCRRLLSRLSTEGAELTFVDPGHSFRERTPGHFALDPEKPEHFRELFRSLARAQRLPGLVVHAWNLEEADSLPNADRAGPASVHPHGSLLWLAQAIMLEHGPESVRIAVLTSGAQAIGGEATQAPLRAMSAAACRVICTEGDGLSAHAIDVEWPPPAGPPGERVRASLLAEVRSDSELGSVALRRGERWAPAFLPRALPPVFDRPVKLRDRGVYLVTGGLGAIGLAVADMLARRAGARLVLLSRMPLPPEAEWDELIAEPETDRRLRDRISAVRRLRHRGAEVMLMAGDVADRRAMRRTVRAIGKEFGTLNGVFHAAGVLDDSLLGQKSPVSIERVLRPKVRGSLALDEATAGLSLDCFVLFSSTSAFLGIPGQSDYAAANAFLDAFADWRAENREGRSVSINWSVWQEIGMAARLADAQGVTVEPTGDRNAKLRHHVLDRVVVNTPHELEVSGRLRSDGTWLLSEHRLRGGHCVLPGTGYLDLVAAAATFGASDVPIVLRDVSFVKPCAVGDDEEREIRVKLKAEDNDDRSFVIRSRPAGRSAEWTEHCHGTVQRANGATAPELSVAVIRQRIAEPARKTRGDEARNSYIDFGPRWDNVRERTVGDGQALLELDLGAAHEGDLAQTVLHPALLDMATAGAQELLDGFDEARHFFVPLSYGKLVLHGAIERQLLSHVRLRPGSTAESDIAVYDVTIVAPDGRVLAEIEEFTMFRLRDTGAFGTSPEQKPAKAAHSPLADALRVGILPAEGVDVLVRVLEHGSAHQVIVAPAGAEQLVERPEPAPAARPRASARLDEDASLELVPPRTPLQEDMVHLASELLGTERLGINEPLVDLGLHSLLAVRLFSRLQRLTGLNVPLAALLEAPTIELLAAKFGDEPVPVAPDPSGGVSGGSDPVEGDAVEGDPVECDPGGGGSIEDDEVEAGGVEAGGVYDDFEVSDTDAYILPPEQAPETFSSLVRLKPSGTRDPFFVVHARGGAVLNYQQLTTFVDADQPVYGLQSQGLDGVTEPLRTIEAMAAHYLERIREIQPHGPYLLGGGSLGGVISLEMAHILKEEGEETALLAMFDTWGPVAFMDTTQLTTQERAGNAVQKIQHLVRERGVRRTLREVRMRAQRSVRESISNGTVRWHRQLQKTLGRQLPHAIRYQFVERVNLAALRIYRPRPWDGDIILFRALDDPDARDPTMGWRETVRGNIRVIDCPGTHNTIMKGPVFGQYLAEELRRAHRAAGESGEPREPTKPGRERTPVR